ncbi:RNA methyltransferase [Flagellimonas allohymeniacidonis]|uniref:RNA methyltransferase n=1 Tax=Flagellimonas allohymeniacidonis TaxID=2517819 RepID=A0A4Q8QHQ8_9FLAO|nr:RNA methyltransferase [Allomuricauda hymeniacidonis]TAI49327.1 RNA methyltransferase [Allomuricauda hymeniacidonis]
MKVEKLISSTQNPLAKKVLALKDKSRERKKTGLFVVEGHREIEMAQKGSYHFEVLLHVPEITSFSIQRFLENQPETEVVQLSKTVYEKIAHRGSTEGVLAICKAKEHGLAQIKLQSNPLILVAEAPEKPGNIGALLRTADAANLDAVLIANPKSDLYNPNSIRSSVGCLFTTQVGIGTSEEIIQFLKQREIKIKCAALSASKTYTESDFTQPTAIVVGTESTGLSDEWLKNSDENLIIPMRGQIDSMNVSVSAAILIFEAGRQRGF